MPLKREGKPTAEKLLIDWLNFDEKAQTTLSLLVENN